MNTLLRSLASAAALAASGMALAAATVGQAAPAFSAVDTGGKTISLSDFKGKVVVLEWLNPGCPFVRKHYDSANMQSSQKSATGRGVVWLSVNSTHSGAGDYMAPAALAGWMKEQGGAPTATLMDVDGKVGRTYGARTTPHLYVVDPNGTLVYAGAIDSKPSANPADVRTAVNYVNQAVTEVVAGKPVSQPVTQAYGCSIKYGD
jgi:hypothetical protein